MALSVYFHPRIFWLNNITGISRYVTELADALMDMGVDVQIPIKDTTNANFRSSVHAGRWESETVPLFPGTKRLMHLLGKLSGKHAEKFRRQVLRWEGLSYLKQGKFDLIHPTHNNAIELLPKLGKTPVVITLHDMTHELRPGSFAKDDPSALRKKLFAQRADRIIAISGKTKEDAVEILGLDPDKIDVVHHGNSLHLPAGYQDMEMDLPERYILFVGQRQGYKNFARFAQAAAQVMRQDDSLHLVCIGGGFTPAEKDLLNQLGIVERTRCRRVSDEELAIAYNRSLAFVYPSEYEGFGLPLLEAFECKAPVLCADASCFPEIAGDAALYFNPLDTEEMAHKLACVVFHEDERQRLIAAGSERRSHFSWRKCAEQTLATYRKALV